MTIGCKLDRQMLRAADGTQYFLGRRDGQLRVIYQRVTEDRGPSAGGSFVWDRTYWHIGAANGKLSKRAAALLKSLGFEEPEKLL